MDKKIIFSGMQPSGIPSLGNYLGALKNWANLQDEFNSLYCIVDMHAITVRQDSVALRKKSRDLLMLYIALGINPEQSIVYFQSHVHQHAELAWILNCYTYMGELNRMTQYKEKSLKNEDNLNTGLFTYPVLMASDILLFQTDLVPIGEDQRQHLELTRDIANRFNNIYGDVFTIPEAYIAKSGSKIMGLQEPTKKMSKSETDNNNNVIFLLDEPNVIMNKVKRATTDSENEIRYSKDKPGISNLLEIYSSITKKTIADSESDFKGIGYGEFKTSVAETIIAEFSPIQEKLKELTKNKDYIDNIIKTNAEKAKTIADRTLRKVQKKVGFPAVPR